MYRIIHRWHSRYDVRLDHRQQWRDIAGCLGGEKKSRESKHTAKNQFVHGRLIPLRFEGFSCDINRERERERLREREIKKYQTGPVNRHLVTPLQRRHPGHKTLKRFGCYVWAPERQRQERYRRFWGPPRPAKSPPETSLNERAKVNATKLCTTRKCKKKIFSLTVCCKAEHKMVEREIERGPRPKKNPQDARGTPN